MHYSINLYVNLQYNSLIIKLVQKGILRIFTCLYHYKLFDNHIVNMAFVLGLALEQWLALTCPTVTPSIVC
jgi:hypothetical protein